MLICIEVSRPFQWAPGHFCATLGGRPNRRVWWGWFAVSWWPGRADEYSNLLSSGVAEWRDA